MKPFELAAKEAASLEAKAVGRASLTNDIIGGRYSGKVLTANNTTAPKGELAITLSNGSSILCPALGSDKMVSLFKDKSGESK